MFLTLIAENTALQLRVESGGRWFAPTQPVTVTREDGTAVTVMAWPTAALELSAPTDHLTNCQRDVLAVLQHSDRRLTRPEICALLEAGKKHHGERTVIDALGTLKDRGLIVGPRPGSSDGYCIPPGGSS